jgi:hypothetical protein
MQSLTANRTIARVAGVGGIAAQLASAYVFILYPALSVPSPANFAFFVAWFVLVAVAIAWWRRHPWRSFVVPIVSVPIAALLLAAGTRLLGWAP